MVDVLAPVPLPFAPGFVCDVSHSRLLKWATALPPAKVATGPALIFASLQADPEVIAAGIRACIHRTDDPSAVCDPDSIAAPLSLIGRALADGAWRRLYGEPLPQGGEGGDAE